MHSGILDIRVNKMIYMPDFFSSKSRQNGSTCIALTSDTKDVLKFVNLSSHKMHGLFFCAFILYKNWWNSNYAQSEQTATSSLIWVHTVCLDFLYETLVFEILAHLSY